MKGLRFILKLFAALSLLVCAAMIPCWVRSANAADYLSFAGPGRDVFEAGWVRGSVFLGHVCDAEREPLVNSYPPMRVKDVTSLSICGLGISVDEHAQGVFAPFWVVMFVTAMPMWLARKVGHWGCARSRGC